MSEDNEQVNEPVPGEAEGEAVSIFLNGPIALAMMQRLGSEQHLTAEQEASLFAALVIEFGAVLSPISEKEPSL